MSDTQVHSNRTESARITVRLSSGERDAVEALARDRRCRVADVVRAGLAAALADPGVVPRRPVIAYTASEPSDD